MPISILCSGCKKKLKVADTAGGKRIRCPVCKAVIAVPAPQEEEPLEVDVEEFDEESAVSEKPMKSDAPSGDPSIRTKKAAWDRTAADDASDAETESGYGISKHDDDEDDDRPRARRRRDDDDDDDDDDDYRRRKRRKKKRRRTLEEEYDVERMRYFDAEPRGFLDSTFADTSIVLLVIFALCCSGIALVVSLVALLTCRDKTAKQNALIVLTIAGFVVALNVIASAMRGAMQ
jgi:LSD1 subclass zinc finger protein